MEDGYAGTSGDDYKKGNAAWDSATNAVTLRPARNQMVGFQIVVERLVYSLTNVSISTGDLQGPSGATLNAANHVEFFKLHYTGESLKYPDPAIPLSSPFSGTFDIPSENNENGMFQSVWCDVYSPDDASPRDLHGHNHPR
jgi:hypothetical protein